MFRDALRDPLFAASEFKARLLERRLAVVSCDLMLCPCECLCMYWQRTHVTCLYRNGRGSAETPSLTRIMCFTVHSRLLSRDDLTGANHGSHRSPSQRNCWFGLRWRVPFLFPRASGTDKEHPFPLRSFRNYVGAPARAPISGLTQRFLVRSLATTG